ncbi:MAG: type II CRISPR RNA-guided endonuclease Cas9 [Bacteroidetes bacterium]|nr:type II CRISPR RNA-guided endonuclease Cas9 [Bacteroidota bacterium]
MKKVLGLDLGTNSIGWALIEQNIENKDGKILGMGSRIIPMTQDIKDEFGKGNSVSQTADRTRFRGVRRLRERHLLRRERLHRVLNVLGFLPEHYANQIDFTKRFGKFITETEPKLTYKANDFLFKKSFEEMLNDFKTNQPQLVENGKLVPYDWTIYYLRKKALTQKLEKEELAWLILNFNQKRGYYQLRGEEEEENPNKLVEFHSLKIIDVVADAETNKKGETWYSLHLENGWIYRRSSKTPLTDWKDKTRDFIVTTDLNDDGSVKINKEGVEKRSFRAPSEDDWTLLKKKTKQDISQSTKTVGSYIYDALLQNPNQKIKGKLVRTIERKFYKDELKQILQKQIELQSELFSDDLYNDCVRELYKNNEAHQMQLSKRDFVHLFLDDIIFYQRPLRSQKATISTCPLEYRLHKINKKDEKGNPIKNEFEKDENGKDIEVKEYLKVIPKSNPLYQEFRLWQWIYNLKIYLQDEDKEVTPNFIQTIEDLESLYDFLSERKEIKQDTLIKHLVEKNLGLKGKALSNEVAKYRWNYVSDKAYPCYETRSMIMNRLEKVDTIPTGFLIPEIEQQLWHIIYSVTDKIEFEKALGSFARKHQLDESSFVENFRRFKPFDSEYGAYSEKAIKKLLPLMRVGKYWDWEFISSSVQERIDKILTGEYDETIKNRVREKAIHLTQKENFQGLQLWLAQYIVYDRHSEAEIAGKWKSVADLEKYINEFKQHSLRNPIVEQVVTETLRVVKDIWKQFGKSAENFFDEIHVELGREMKNTADERKRLTNTVTENENTNLRIKAMLVELMSDANVIGVRPHSPMQQEALKIYEEGVLKSGIEIPEDISKISKSAQPTKAEFQKYKLWLEQKYKSPYTGQMIPLNRLFTEDYQIEHIVPQSRYFDDSISNKVICEAAVNQLKDKQLGFEFIKNHGGQTVETGFGKTVKILREDSYQELVKENYKSNRTKLNKLLLEEIPDKMIERQMNDTRYISKFISQLLSNIVRSETNDDGVNSKNILPGNGKITTQLKQDWGLNDVWNDLILPRFERMNELTQTSDFTTKNTNGKTIPTIPLEHSKGFQKKRIDHRHHAMDALVIACATRDHVNLLNNQSAKSDNSRYDLQRKLRKVEKWQDKEGKERDKFTDFFKPWSTFTPDAKNELEKIVVSFKQNLRVINKASNQYEKMVNGKKVLVKQEGTNWAIRKPMHKDTVSGLIQLRKTKLVALSIALDNYNDIVDKALRKHILSLIAKNFDKKKIAKYLKDNDNKWNNADVSRVEIYYWENDNVASRVNLDTSFSKEKIEKSITDTGIQQILLNHLTNYEGQIDEKGKAIAPEILAFTPEGIDEMNKNITSLNNGKFHQPILKVRTYEPKGNKFAIGETGNKKDKFVEAAKGTNLFFAIYADENGKRSYETIPLNIVIERQKQGLLSVPEQNEKGHNLLFHLSPNDIVYVPNEEENVNAINLNKLTKEQTDKVYKMVSCTGSECHFIQSKISSLIKTYDSKSKMGEMGSLNKQELTMFGHQRVKEICIKLKIDRLGNISKT